MIEETPTRQGTMPVGDSTQRPLPSAGTGLAAAEVTEGPKLEAYMGKLLVVCPLQHEEWETSFGKADVLVSYILVVSYTMDAENRVSVDWEDLGETPIFWSFVKKQVDEQSTPELPWVVGTLSKGSRAYRLVPPLPEDLRAAEMALTEFQEQTSSQY